MNETINLETILHATKFHRNLAIGIAAGAATGYALANGPRKIREIRLNLMRRNQNDK